MNLIRATLHELRLASRGVRRAPGFFAIAVTILALGVGMSAAMFSLFHTVLVRQLPVVDPDRVVVMRDGVVLQVDTPVNVYERPYNQYVANFVGHSNLMEAVIVDRLADKRGYIVEIAGQRYSHIVDPRTGLGLTGRSSVTVVARDCTTADSLATAVSVLGPQAGLKLVEETPSAAALIVLVDDQGRKQVLASKRLEKYDAAENKASGGR